MSSKATISPPPSPVVLPDVATEPHPTAHAIPEPPGADEDALQQVVSDASEPRPPAPTS